MNKLQITILDLIFPLPDPKTEQGRYRGLSFPHLSGHQIELIIEMVIEEAKVSRKFGLFIRPEDLTSEIIFWLTFVNQVGPASIRESNYQQTWGLASEASQKAFDEPCRYYFDKISNSKPKITSANTAYNCHLQAVQARILIAIYSNHFPPI